jgi:hypothetical protein
MGRRAHTADLWSVVHREFGPICTLLTRKEAEQALEEMLRDEPGWADKLSVEPFSFRVGCGLKTMGGSFPKSRPPLLLTPRFGSESRAEAETWGSAATPGAAPRASESVGQGAGGASGVGTRLSNAEGYPAPRLARLTPSCSEWKYEIARKAGWARVSPSRARSPRSAAPPPAAAHPPEPHQSSPRLPLPLEEELHDLLGLGADDAVEEHDARISTGIL